MHHLLGLKLPDVALVSTSGGTVNPSTLQGTSILFCYPYTGRPGFADPPDWDSITGAHGSTPQALAYSEACEKFTKQNMQVYGLSFQTPEWQQEFVARTALQVPLLSDSEKRFSNLLGLPTFIAGAEHFLQRMTLVASSGVIAKVRFPVKSPAEDAAETLLSVSS